MIDFPYIRDLVQSTPTKIVMLVVDGLGGAPHPDTGKTELETANLPNLDRLAGESASGMTIPVAPGITPGSGPGHMALFGFDPVKYLMGRGVLEALGIGINLANGDIAARGNFCTVDASGRITDRRAGRIATEESVPLVEKLAGIQVPGVEMSVHPVKDHRFVLVLKGNNLGEAVSGTDPEKTGVVPLPASAVSSESRNTAEAVNVFVSRARDILRGQKKANMVVLRGFSRLPSLPSMAARYALKPAAIAAYPMYRGLAQMVGMEVLKTGATFADELATLEKHHSSHDFFFLHYKPADAAGEDGDFAAKVVSLESLDREIPRLLKLNPDVLVVAGDHSTPAMLGAHGWQPVPLLIRSKWTKGEGTGGFSERACRVGSLGTNPATSVMMLAMAHAGKLHKFGP
ncbi:MAG: 2,3-bisphosphoglycerate-independent phosphoglycerate mutase [SAR202 cluster bacterium]|nr:2,3-bisphosphoglycerate-independent phosphoglycerate mutase [SAR202 cluster bacterium]